MTPLELMRAAGVKDSPATNLEYLENWLKVKDLAKALTATEMTMRKALFGVVFPDPKEGVNTSPLPDGRKLVATHKINRTIDESQISAARAEYDLLNDRPVEFDDLLKVKHELVTSAFRKLSDAPLLAASRMIIAKAGTPSMEVK